MELLCYNSSFLALYEMRVFCLSQIQVTGPVTSIDLNKVEYIVDRTGKCDVMKL